MNKLDLDALIPEPKTVILNGRDILVQPPKLKQVFKMQKAFLALQDGDDGASDKVIDAIATIVPDIKNDDVDLTVTQLQALVDFISEMATGGATKGKPIEEKKTP